MYIHDGSKVLLFPFKLTLGYNIWFKSYGETYIIQFYGIKQIIPKLVRREKVRLGLYHVSKHIWKCYMENIFGYHKWIMYNGFE